MKHLSETDINDLADGTSRTDAAAAHVAACDDCAARVQRLRALRARLRALPPEIMPARDLLPDIAAVIHRGESAPAVPAPDPARSLRRPLLAAAAVVCVMIGAALAAVLLRAPAAPPGASAPATDIVQLAGLRAAEAQYVDAIAELRAALGVGTLDPGTEAVLQRSLAAIDRALDEARAALAAEPENAALATLLRAGYEKKLDLLRRASTHQRGSL